MFKQNDDEKLLDSKNVFQNMWEKNYVLQINIL